MFEPCVEIVCGWGLFLRVLHDFDKIKKNTVVHNNSNTFCICLGYVLSQLSPSSVATLQLCKLNSTFEAFFHSYLCQEVIYIDLHWFTRNMKRTYCCDIENGVLFMSVKLMTCQSATDTQLLRWVSGCLAGCWTMTSEKWMFNMFHSISFYFVFLLIVFGRYLYDICESIMGVYIYICRGVSHYIHNMSAILVYDNLCLFCKSLQ